MQRRHVLQSIAALLASTGTQAGAADARWPSRNITYIVPFAAGGASDVLARMVMQRKRPVIPS